MKKVTITLSVNTDDDDEAHTIVDEWVGLTAPESIDSFNVHVNDDKE